MPNPRDLLLIASLLVSGIGFWWLFDLMPLDLRAELLALVGVYLIAASVALWHYRTRLTRRVLTANLATGALSVLAAGSLLSGGAWLVGRGVLPALGTGGRFLAVGALGSGAAFFAWTRARGEDADVAVSVVPERLEPAPTTGQQEAPEFEALMAGLVQRGDQEAIRHIAAWERLHEILSEQAPSEQVVAAAVRTVRQEVRRLELASQARLAEEGERDGLSKAAAMLEWGAQKLPELRELDLGDMLMAKAIADIHALHDAVDMQLVDHRELLAIHPIDRDTAERKCDERAEAARTALPLLQEHGMRLTEALIAAEPALAAFKSVNGFQVVSLGEGEGFVTFEGNGRREALRRAFPTDEAVWVEVRWFRFRDLEVAETIARRVRRVREWKSVVD